MNILIHQGDPYPNELPSGNRIRVFVDELTAKGHHVVVMAPYKMENVALAENVLYCPAIKLTKKTTLMRMLNQLSFAVSSLFCAARAGKIDMVLTTAPPALTVVAGWAIAKCKRAKHVFDVRDIWPDVALEMGSFDKNSLYSRIFTFIRDFMLRHSDLVTTVSPGKVRKLKAYAPEAEVVFVTNGLDEDFLSNTYRPEVAEKYGLDQGFNCVYFGNIGWAQGLMQLMHLAERAQETGMNARFLLFGSGVEENSLRQYAEKHKLTNVVFAGRIPNSEMYTILNSAQMSFIPLVNENLKDSVPTKMFEALGVGCPVLLSAVGDAADILHECKLGMSVSPNDTEALWAAFQKMYENMDQYLDYRSYAKEVILRKYSRQKAALLLEKEIAKMMQLTY